MGHLAWLRLRNQPDSALSAWRRDRVRDGRGRIKRVAITALPRKLLVASWRFVTRGLVPTGAVLKRAHDGEQDSHGQTRRNDTHATTADPDARPYCKGRGREAKVCFMGHALMENRKGLIVGAVASRTSGHAEQLAALHRIEPHAERPQAVTLGGDKGFDTQDFGAAGSPPDQTAGPAGSWLWRLGNR